MAGVLNDMHAFRFNVAGAAGNYDFICTRGWLVVDQIATANASVGGATVRLNRSTAAAPGVFNAVGPALDVATADQIQYVGALVPAQATFSTGDTMRMVAVNNGQADLIVDVIPTTWVPG